MNKKNETHQKNKLAWEEAFSHQSESFRENTIHKLSLDPKLLFSPRLNSHLEKIGQKGGVVAQFCSNNGRETMATLAYGFHQSIGFDIAANMVEFANHIAKDLNLNASFVQTDILEIDASYVNQFDAILITVGALCWFKDLNAFFEKLALCLKSNGYLIIEEAHPLANCLASKSENNYDASHPSKLVNDYFKTSPWIENTGMGYMTDKPYESLTFESYSHTLSNLLNALSRNHLELIELDESDIDQSNLFVDLNKTGIPLTMNILAKKKKEGC
jgi:SAM-dependent methyltransferase